MILKKENINYKDSIRIEYIIDLLDQNKLNWKSGYFIEDFLYTFGINIDRNILLFIFFFILSIFLIYGFLFICLLIKKKDKKLKSNNIVLYINIIYKYNIISIFIYYYCYLFLIQFVHFVNHHLYFYKNFLYLFFLFFF